jgi:transposase
MAGAEQEAALRELAVAPVRGEADRARAVLLTLSGWTAAEIGEAFGVGEDSVRRWRAWLARGGTDALRSTLAPGPSPERGRRALARARGILAEPVQDRPNWTLPRLRAEVEARTGGRLLSPSHPSVLLRRGASAGGGPATA